MDKRYNIVFIYQSLNFSSKVWSGSGSKATRSATLAQIMYSSIRALDVLCVPFFISNKMFENICFGLMLEKIIIIKIYISFAIVPCLCKAPADRSFIDWHLAGVSQCMYVYIPTSPNPNEWESVKGKYIYIFKKFAIQILSWKI